MCLWLCRRDLVIHLELTINRCFMTFGVSVFPLFLIPGDQYKM
ncbi:hypothetical protein BVRB_9g224460 [Beta vulgaris subsp. vulgaris]|uniref:Uncharacterized protein n=1 Tax=Beta vulgaris subsp. vulgaris TaxID=3555 RepID=A0A0J8E097_BETVV|nr:hypothetical protein BVRB_9g224460 [Beta vulgaris subsp. vulgaris]